MFDTTRSARHDAHAYGDSWFVYVLAASVDSAFKMGFSCNPLQRAYSFNRRYFERFDLERSLLLLLPTCAEARVVESIVKRDLAAVRCDAPTWVIEEAGGHTEWFNVDRFAEAEAYLRSYLPGQDGRLVRADTYIREQLQRTLPSFELWAVAQARRVRDDVFSVTLGYEPLENIDLLRDWLDAYKFFGIALFECDPGVLQAVTECARLQR
jgi:hypothetical protein